MYPYALLQSEHALLGLSMAYLLCSGRESCFQFVNSGGMQQIAMFFPKDGQSSTTIMLLLLGVVERATRYSVGCEGFLGWWPREDENIPSGISEGYSHLLKLILSKPRHDVASLATYLLHRLRFYEVASRYEVLLSMNVLDINVSLHLGTSSLSYGNEIFASLQFCLCSETSVLLAGLQMLR